MHYCLQCLFCYFYRDFFKYLYYFFCIIFTRNIICLKLASLRKTRYIFIRNLFLCIDRDYRVFSHTIVLSVTNPDLTNEKCDESIPIEDNPMRPEGDLQQHQLPNDRIMGLFHISWAVSFETWAIAIWALQALRDIGSVVDQEKVVSFFRQQLDASRLKMKTRLFLDQKPTL